MSVKVHEPVCLDSAQQFFFWFDHFLGDQLKDEWGAGTDGAGTVAVADQQTGGIIRLTTGNVLNNDTWIEWSAIRSLLASQKETMEFRLKLDSIDDVQVLNSLRQDSQGQIVFWYSTAAGHTTWRLQNINTGEGGGTTNADSLVTVDTNWNIFRIETHTHGALHVHYYINGIETAGSPITTNVSTEYHMPYLSIRTKAAATKFMDIDYVVARQER